MTTAKVADDHIGLLFDATRCIGCQECAKACKSTHGQSATLRKDLSADSHTVVESQAGQFMRRLCMHCLHPTCVSVCPVAALAQQPGGQVTYDATACMGCRYCIMACPFSIPRYEWDRVLPTVRKCDFCVERTSAGEQTACSWVCPTGATQSGKRNALLAEARARIQGDPARYVDHIYGEDEAGGTSVLILSGVPFAQTSYRPGMVTEALPELTWHVLEKLPYIVLNGAIVLGGLSWIIKRKMEFERHPELTEDLKRARAKSEGGH
ncbi:MAG: 4Fe-4S dicluster domain-containing protein [Lentisphaerae bacterium]|nr:4Fe-4S dicluster domain-containing protein [Lentisphaerota bacterium]